MTRIVVDSAMLARLGDLSAPAELWDESGRMVGYFTPAVGQAEQECLEPTVSDEELRRRERSAKWHTTAEVLKHLEQL
jgi:hypothetical protein